MEQDHNDVNHGKRTCYPLESKHDPLAPMKKRLIDKATNQPYQPKLKNNNNNKTEKKQSNLKSSKQIR